MMHGSFVWYMLDVAVESAAPDGMDTFSTPSFVYSFISSSVAPYFSTSSIFALIALF